MTTTGNTSKRFRYGSLDLLCVHTEAYYVGGVVEERGLLARKKPLFFILRIVVYLLCVTITLTPRIVLYT